MTEGRNFPKLDRMDAERAWAWVKYIAEHPDLTGKQKLIAICIATRANTDWQGEVSNSDLQRMVRIKDTETVAKATRELIERGIIAREKQRGYVNRYTVLPATVVESIVAEYNARKEVPLENRDTPLPENPGTPLPLNRGTLPLENRPTPPPLPTKNRPTPLPENRGTTPPEKSANPLKPDRISPASTTSCAYSINNNLLNLEDTPNTPLSPPKAELDPLVGQFEIWWTEYPASIRKHGKGECLQLFRQAITGNRHPGKKRPGKVLDYGLATPQQLITAVRKYAATNPDPEYVPSPMTWLNQGRWLDEPQSRPAPRYAGKSQTYGQTNGTNYDALVSRETAEMMRKARPVE